MYDFMYESRKVNIKKILTCTNENLMLFLALGDLIGFKNIQPYTQTHTLIRWSKEKSTQIHESSRRLGEQRVAMGMIYGDFCALIRPHQLWIIIIIIKSKCFYWFSGNENFCGGWPDPKAHTHTNTCHFSHVYTVLIKYSKKNLSAQTPKKWAKKKRMDGQTERERMRWR